MKNSPDSAINNADAPRLALSRVAAARAIAVSPRTIDMLIADRSSGFPIVRIGGRVVVPIGPLETWLAEQAQKKGDRK